MNRFGIFTVALAVIAIVCLPLLGGCSFLDKQADKQLGPACTEQARFARAGMLTDMLDKRYGEEFPAAVSRLRDKVKIMGMALIAGDGLDAAGDSYKADFVSLAGLVLAKRGIKTALGGYSDAVDRLKTLPELVADINEIEARVRIACATETGG